MLYRITAIVELKESDPLMAEEVVDNALTAQGWEPQMVVANAIDKPSAPFRLPQPPFIGKEDDDE